MHKEVETNSQNILIYKTTSLQFPDYYFNRNYYSTLFDHEFVQEEFLNLSNFIHVTQNRDEAIVLAICKHIRE